MPRNLYNWTFNDVAKFLKNNGFKLANTEGSHYYFGKLDGHFRIVQVPFHGKKALKAIILQSGISQSKWTGK